jgi:hypothetical protein
MLSQYIRKMSSSQFVSTTGNYATGVYGAAGSQHAASGFGNTIAQTPVQCGGYRSKSKSSKRSKSRKGGNMLSKVAVPAVLLAANHFYSKKGLRDVWGRSNKSFKSKKYFNRSSRRFTRRRR